MRIQHQYLHDYYWFLHDSSQPISYVCYSEALRQWPAGRKSNVFAFQPVRGVD